MKKKRINGSDIALMVLCAFAAAFVVAMIVTWWRFQSVPDALIYGFFGASGLELGGLVKIYLEKKRSG